MNTKNKLMGIDHVNELIEAGHVLTIAGHETLLKQLNKGNWIGGTTTYFMDKEGGGVNRQEVFVTDLTAIVTDFKIKAYEETTITTALLEDQYENGFSYLILPAFASIHQAYGLHAGEQSTLFDRPLMGWIAGVHLDEIGKVTPKVIDGSTGTFFENRGCTLHGALSDKQYAEVDIINIYQQGTGDTFTFQEDGFSCTTCLINGEPANLADYYVKNNINVDLPLVANYAGASINVSIQHLNKEQHQMDFFAPVLNGIEYKVAQPIDDLYTVFQKELPEDSSAVIFSCNCILNYVHIEMEKKFAGDFRGPFTFGEVAYILVNQTMVTLSIKDY